MADVDWVTRPVLEVVDKVLLSGMRRAMLHAEGIAKRKVSRLNPGGVPSRPGEPPRLVTGTLRSNIAGVAEERGRDIVGALGVRKGPADKYARRLELGFKGTDAAGRNVSQAARPYLRPTITENRKKLLRLMLRGKV